MSDNLKFVLASKRFLNDSNLDEYLMFLDYEVCNDAETWCKNNAPTAIICRQISTKDLYLYITWYIEFTNKNELVFYQLSK